MATGYDPGTVKSPELEPPPIVTDNCRVLLMVWLAGSCIARSWPLKVALTAGDAGLFPVPKNPPFTLNDKTPAVPCGMLLGEGPTTPGRTPITVIWQRDASVVHVWAVPDCSETLIWRVPEGGGTARM